MPSFLPLLRLLHFDMFRQAPLLTRSPFLLLFIVIKFGGWPFSLSLFLSFSLDCVLIVLLNYWQPGPGMVAHSNAGALCSPALPVSLEFSISVSANYRRPRV